MTLLYSKCGLSEPTGVARIGLFLTLIFELADELFTWAAERYKADLL